MQVKPLNQITKRPSNSSSATAPTSIDNYDHHSNRSKGVSKQYHKNVGNVGTRAVDGLNPDTAIPAHKLFPGLPN